MVLHIEIVGRENNHIINRDNEAVIMAIKKSLLILMKRDHYYLFFTEIIDSPKISDLITLIYNTCYINHAYAYEERVIHHELMGNL